MAESRRHTQAEVPFGIRQGHCVIVASVLPVGVIHAYSRRAFRGVSTHNDDIRTGMGQRQRVLKSKTASFPQPQGVDTVRMSFFS